MIFIRKAIKNDVDAILLLMKELVDFHSKIDSYYKSFTAYRGLRSYLYKSLRDENKLVLVAEKDGEIIGYFLGEIENAPFYSKERKIGIVADTAVSKSDRRQGVLKELFKNALTWFKEKGVYYLELSVHVKNQTALAAWRKFGFFEYRLRMRRKL